MAITPMIGFRPPGDMRQRLEKLAAASTRTLSNYIIFVLDKHLKETESRGENPGSQHVGMDYGIGLPDQVTPIIKGPATIHKSTSSDGSVTMTSVRGTAKAKANKKVKAGDVLTADDIAPARGKLCPHGNPIGACFDKKKDRRCM